MFWWRCSHVPRHCFQEWFFFYTDNQAVVTYQPGHTMRTWPAADSLSKFTDVFFVFLIGADGWKKRHSVLCWTTYYPLAREPLTWCAFFAHAWWFCTFLWRSPPWAGKNCFWCCAGSCLWTSTRSPFIRSDGLWFECAFDCVTWEKYFMKETGNSALQEKKKFPSAMSDQKYSISSKGPLMQNQFYQYFLSVDKDFFLFSSHKRVPELTIVMTHRTPGRSCNKALLWAGS